MSTFTSIIRYTRFIILLSILFLPVNLWADCQVSLQWDPNSDPNVYYQLYLREQGAPYDFNSFEWQGSQTQCTVYQLDETKTYYFVVRATDANGIQSGNSNEVTFKYGVTSTGLGGSGSIGSSGGGGGGGGSGAGCFVQTLLHP